MSQSAASPSRIITFSHEDVIEVIDELTNVETLDTGGTVVHTGAHPKYGNVHIVVPAIGDSILMLPFAIQQF